MSYPWPLRNVSGTINATFDTINAQNTIVTNFNGPAGVTNPPTYTTITNNVNTSGTYTSPIGTSFIIVECVGGGASGGATNSTTFSGGGGGGGAYFKKKYAAGSYSYTVGGSAGGVVLANGNNGNDTVFNGDIAGGGIGGTGSTFNGGLGGTCTVTGEIISINGGGGGGGFRARTGRGGKSFYGTGAGQVYMDGVLIAPWGSLYGGGGGGGYNNGFAGDGAQGVILITVYS
jgi:hypothetical protein